jgi:hypothetical protein
MDRGGKRIATCDSSVQQIETHQLRVTLAPLGFDTQRRLAPNVTSLLPDAISPLASVLRKFNVDIDI